MTNMARYKIINGPGKKAFKFVFINPPKTFKDIASNSPPLNILSLASYIRQELPMIDVSIIDGLAGKTINEVKMKVLESDPDLIGITSTTPTILEAYEIADWCRAKGYPVVMGGVHVSVMPEEALKHCDYVVVNEGELALKELIQEMMKKDFGKIEPIISRPYLKDINQIEIPAYDLIDMEYYVEAEDNSVRGLGYAKPDSRAITILTSRGCPYRCIFCHNSWRQMPVRFRSPERVLEEVKYLIEKYAFDAFFFADDEFLVNQKRTREILKLFRKNKIKITWGCQARADTVIRWGKRGLTYLKNNGCSMIAIGAESGNQRVLNLLKADSSKVEWNKKSLEMIHEAGIKPCASFIIGTPTETREEMEDTIKLLKESKIVAGGICLATPYPGTKLYKMCVERGLITGEADYYKYRPNIRPEEGYIICDTIPKDEFIKLYNKISKEIGEHVVYNATMSGGKSLWLQTKSAMRKYPGFVILWVLKHPIKSIRMVMKR